MEAFRYLGFGCSPLNRPGSFASFGLAVEARTVLPFTNPPSLLKAPRSALLGHLSRQPPESRTARSALSSRIGRSEGRPRCQHRATVTAAN
jgi:hypothetical protein